MDFKITRYDFFTKSQLVVGEYISIAYEVNNKIKDRELIEESEAVLILADANISFLNSIRKSPITTSTIEENISKLQNGFIIYADKVQQTVTIYTDVFGFNHLFYKKENESFILSNSYQTLLKDSKKEIDDFSILDMCLFNYTLLDRTLLRDIKRLIGGSKVVVSQTSTCIESPFNFANNFRPNSNKNNFKPSEYAHLLTNAIKDELSTGDDVALTMTAGFDSRALLAVCKKLDLNFSTFTFGQKGNIEIETIKPFIEEFSDNHTFFELDTNYIHNLDNTLEQFLVDNLDCPTILDLPHYTYVREKLKGGNIITGYMGGELMQGQSVGAQVTLTAFAASLLETRNVAVLKPVLLERMQLFSFFDHNKIKQIADQYIETLNVYFSQENNLNILRFLINEKFAKFFGAINKVFHNHSNLLTPFVSVNLIEYILNSNLSFLRKEPFKNNPIVNYRSKTYYAKTIKLLSPELGSTKFDRLYSVDDLCHFYNYPKAAIGYFKSHFLKTNKKQPKPHNYDYWYKNIIINSISSKNLKTTIYNEDFSLDKVLYEKLLPTEKKAYTNITAVLIAYDKIIKSK